MGVRGGECRLRRRAEVGADRAPGRPQGRQLKGGGLGRRSDGSLGRGAAPSRHEPGDGPSGRVGVRALTAAAAAAGMAIVGRPSRSTPPGGSAQPNGPCPPVVTAASSVSRADGAAGPNGVVAAVAGPEVLDPASMGRSPSALRSASLAIRSRTSANDTDSVDTVGRRGGAGARRRSSSAAPAPVVPRSGIVPRRGTGPHRPWRRPARPGRTRRARSAPRRSPGPPGPAGWPPPRGAWVRRRVGVGRPRAPAAARRRRRPPPRSRLARGRRSRRAHRSGCARPTRPSPLVLPRHGRAPGRRPGLGRQTVASTRVTTPMVSMVNWDPISA